MVTLRQGITTGTCAAAAAHAAALSLQGLAVPAVISVTLPDGEVVPVPIAAVRQGSASVIKDAGDDPDITHGAEVCVSLRPLPAGAASVFVAGPGVGTVTKPGLQVPPGEPAINPVPRRMILEAIEAVTRTPMEISLSIPGGVALAEKTFNPRLGVEGGLSILGTTGRVRPFSHEAIQETVRCAVDVAEASGIKDLVLVPGNIGARAAKAILKPPQEQLIEVSNEWGTALDAARGRFNTIAAVGHPGKLLKLVMGHWNTHSKESPSAVPCAMELAETVLQDRLRLASSETVQGVLDQLPGEDRLRLGEAMARQIAAALQGRFSGGVQVVLIQMDGTEVGRACCGGGLR